MGKQGIIPIQNMGNGIFLVGHQGNLWCHSHKLDMASIIFPWTDTVEQFIVCPADVLPPFHILKNPFFVRILDHFLFLLCQHRFFFIQDTFFFPILFDSIINFGIL